VTGVRRLVVNADDFGRTDGIVEGTLQAHLEGIVTSATVMVLEPAAGRGIREAIRRAPRLSLGLHCVLTGGGPPSAAGSLPTLAPRGRFARTAEALPRGLDPDEVRRELESQIRAFEGFAGRLPSHLDSHHHAALHPEIAPVFSEVARERGLPVRAASTEALAALRRGGLETPDAFFDGFYGGGATVENLLSILAGLPTGVSELMCHPGHSDAELAAGSRYAAEREGEIAVLCDPRVRKAVAEHGIELVPFALKALDALDAHPPA
jgi:predicted glycoside hydrolase/deacetylase ChbG (UPF0249 family)